MQAVILEMVRRWGRTGLAVLDLTFAKDVGWDAAQRCLNSLRTNVLAERYGKRYIVICERGERGGRFHFHILFYKDGADFYTGSNWYWNAKKRREDCNRNEECRAEWRFFRGVLKGYGFGDRVAITPLRSVEAGANYFSKYVGKGHFSRTTEMHGKQLVRYGDPLQAMHSAKFSFAHGGARDRRRVLGRVAGEMSGCEDCPNVEDYDDLRNLFGPQWAYDTLEEFAVASLAFGPVCMGRKALERAQALVWGKWKMRCFFKELPDGRRLLQGAHRYQIRPELSRKYLKVDRHGRPLFVPDDDSFEAVEYVSPAAFADRAMSELRGKFMLLADSWAYDQIFPGPSGRAVTRKTQQGLRADIARNERGDYDEEDDLY